MILQIIPQRRRAEGAVAFSDQKLRRIPAVVAAQVGDDELRESLYIFIDPVKIFFLSFADGVAVARAHGVDEDEIGFVEEALGVVHELVRSRRRKDAVHGVRAARPKGAHVQPHGGGTGATVVEKGDRAKAQIFHVAARVGHGIEQVPSGRPCRS